MPTPTTGQASWSDALVTLAVAMAAVASAVAIVVFPALPAPSPSPSTHLEAVDGGALLQAKTPAVSCMRADTSPR
jgi:hypothetical protein